MGIEKSSLQEFFRYRAICGEAMNLLLRTAGLQQMAQSPVPEPGRFNTKFYIAVLKDVNPLSLNGSAVLSCLQRFQKMVVGAGLVEGNIQGELVDVEQFGANIQRSTKTFKGEFAGDYITLQSSMGTLQLTEKIITHLKGREIDDDDFQGQLNRLEYKFNSIKDQGSRAHISELISVLSGVVSNKEGSRGL